jgi:hypothetical protein
MLEQIMQQRKRETGHVQFRMLRKADWPKFFATFQQYTCPGS